MEQKPKSKPEKSPKEKIIRDAVHGYIHIDTEYFKLIDTPNFQRLKRLEQTNSRPVYPCAHHDRFVHSLGVFHLGKMAISYIEENSKEEIKNKVLWERAKKSFELACLLHDIGHSPFSHTFEYAFLEEKDNNNVSSIDNILNGEGIHDIKIKSDGGHVDERKHFIEDFSERKGWGTPPPHEKVSAILVLTEYYDTVIGEEFQQDPFLIARMILGLKYQKKNERTKDEHLFYNCFIELLNSDSIDVDKLDYLTRDQWATGHISKLIDYERIFSSMYIKKRKIEKDYVVCYHKRCINELLGLMEAQKLINVSMHSHHIVKYDEYVLKRAIEEIAKIIDEGAHVDDKKTLSQIFSLNSLFKEKMTLIDNGLKFKLITDDDIIHLLKIYIDQSSYAKEWFYRQYELKAVWKTYSDYKYFFREFNDSQRDALFNNKKTIIEQFLRDCSFDVKKYYINDKKLTGEYNPNLSINVKIFIKEEVVNLEDIRKSYDLERDNKEKEEAKRYFLLYLPKELIEDKDIRDAFIDFTKKQIEILSSTN